MAENEERTYVPAHSPSLLQYNIKPGICQFPGKKFAG